AWPRRTGMDGPRNGISRKARRARRIRQGFQCRKLRYSARPWAALFSGWNWVAKMLSRASAEVMRAHLDDLVPAHLRHLVAAAVVLHPAFEAEAHDLAGDQAETGSAAQRIAFLAAVEQHLHANADAEQRLGRRRLADRVLEAGSAQLAHAVGHRALPRQDDALGGGDGLGVGRDDDVERLAVPRRLARDVGDGLGDRAEVAHAVVDDGDGASHG